MAEFRVKVNEPAWLRIIREKQRSVAEAAVAALRETAAESVQEGRRNIAGAGKFGPKWQQGLQYRTKGATVDGMPSLQASAIVFHKFGIAGVFEHGATIHGKPLLWIPTTRGEPAPSRSGKQLVSATIRGKPMLFDANDRDRERTPLYIGVPQVRIPKKFKITEIVRQHVARIGALFIKHFKG
jgi:hypothetical protein